MSLAYVLCVDRELTDVDISSLMRNLRAHPEFSPQPATTHFEVSIRAGQEPAIAASASRFERACCSQSYIQTTGTVAPGQLRHILLHSWRRASRCRYRPMRAELAPLIGQLRSSLRRTNGGVIIIARPAIARRSLLRSPIATPPKALVHGTLLALVIRTRDAPPRADASNPRLFFSDLEIIREFCLVQPVAAASSPALNQPNRARPQPTVRSLAV